MESEITYALVTLVDKKVMSVEIIEMTSTLDGFALMTCLGRIPGQDVRTYVNREQIKSIVPCSEEDARRAAQATSSMAYIFNYTEG